jgi:hypothetical protein
MPKRFKINEEITGTIERMAACAAAPGLTSKARFDRLSMTFSGVARVAPGLRRCRWRLATKGGRLRGPWRCFCPRMERLVHAGPD